MSLNTSRLTTALALLLVVFTFAASAEPFNIIIVTNDGGDPEKLYRQFLQDIYAGYVDLNINPDRYDESLSDKKKAELSAADLIIVSRDTEGTQYNGDADFWNSVEVPILNHNAKLARSDDHRFWDYLDGDAIACLDCNDFEIVNPADPVFDGLDTSGPTIPAYLTPTSFDISDQTSAGYGTVVATAGGNVAIARWLGDEPNYYDGSDYRPGAPRLFFAMPDKSRDFFENASDQSLQMLRNALFSLLPPALPDGDLDLDADVDFEDFALTADCWTGFGSSDPCLCGPAALVAVASTWLQGVDLTPPEPDPLTWDATPETVSTDTIAMTADLALDDNYGVRYFFQCTSGNGPDSTWQYRRTFEPNNLLPGRQYTYRIKARDTSSNANETQWSQPESAKTFGLFTHIADASAAVALTDNLAIVGGDEASYLRVYDFNCPGSAPVASFSIADYLNIEPSHPEVDIEGATWLNGRIFWISSHGRNKQGEYWYSRYQFFATTVTVDGSNISVTVDGNYTNLIDHLIAYDAIYGLGLADAIGVAGGHIDPSTISDLAPKIDGLNIEGLAATPDDSSLLIGFRNPRPEFVNNRYALIIKLTNPEQVVLYGADPVFESPILLDTGSFGIRSIEYSPSIIAYLIVAGSHKSGADEPLQELYTYNSYTAALHKIHEFPILTPEALFQFPASPEVQLLSDDGTLLFDTPEGPIENKYLPTEQRTFRTQTLTP